MNLLEIFGLSGCVSGVFPEEISGLLTEGSERVPIFDDGVNIVLGEVYRYDVTKIVIDTPRKVGSVYNGRKFDAHALRGW